MLQPQAAAVPTTSAAMAVAPAARDGLAAPNSGSAGNSSAAGGPKGQAAPNTPWDRMILRTATLALQVKDVGAALDSVSALAAGHSGYILTTNSTGSGADATATVAVQVPAAEFDGIMPQLRRLAGKVLDEQVSSSDVTEEYTDLQSQLRNLQATEGRMLTLQAKAEKLDDILTLDRELRSVQGEIERIQGRVNFLSKRAAMSTITLTLTPVGASAPAPVPAAGWSPVENATRAWNASLDLLAGVADVVITVVVFLWWAVPLGLLAVLLLRPWRRQERQQTAEF